MTVAHDAATAADFADTPAPFTFSHTPVGTPSGVLVVIPKTGTGNGVITGMTYGGVALTMSTSIYYAADTASELGSIFIGFLGSGIPTGTQTVSIAHNGNVSVKRPVCITVAAAADTEILVSAEDNEDQSNPSAALDTGAASALRYAGIYSGHNDPASLALLSGMTAVDTKDFGTASAVVSRETTASSGSFTIGWTATSEDVAALYVAIQEAVAAAENPYPYVGGGYYPTEG